MLITNTTRAIAQVTGGAIGAGYGALHAGIGTIPGALQGSAKATGLHALVVGGAKGGIYGALHGGIGAVPGALIGIRATLEGVSVARMAARLFG